jgi:hypothetical protein
VGKSLPALPVQLEAAAVAANAATARVLMNLMMAGGLKCVDWRWKLRCW